MRCSLLNLAAGLCGLLSITWQAFAASDLVVFPSSYADGIHYATVHRGNIREELFTSPAAIEAAKMGQPVPSGTVITMEDYRDGKLFRYVVMEKRVGWGADYPTFQAFNADKTVNPNENVDRCFACHKGQANQDFVFTLDRMQRAP